MDKVVGCRSLCPATCNDPNPTCIQPFVCTPACVCPKGTVLDENNNQCVELTNCSSFQCPAQGQVIGCQSLCPPTCDQPTPTCIQPYICQIGCTCPSGTVLEVDMQGRPSRCVTLDKCPSHCDHNQVLGCQSLCPATCDDPNPTCIQPFVCNLGCVCPIGTVLDTYSGQCVDPTQCNAAH